MNAVDPVFAPFLDAIAPRKSVWSYDYERWEDTDTTVYFVYDESNFTVATCRLREHAEQIVSDHNSAADK